MNTLSKSFPLAVIASLVTACAGTAHVAANASAPRVCEGRTLETDRDVQAFAGCGAVRGDLKISGAVTTLAPLASVQSVSGALEVESALELDSLDGLEQLRSVSDLVLAGNAELDDIGALGSLEAVRSITLAKNPELRDLRGLESVRELERLTIEKNGIFTLRGLSNLEKVGVLRLENNRLLNDARSLSGVLDADEVVNNSRLAGYSGILPNLRRQPDHATVTGNTLCALETAHLSSTPSTRTPTSFSGIANERAERLQARF
jgi:hypothetical protein